MSPEEQKQQVPSNGFQLAPDSGISEEEQREIISHIEEVATENRIKVSPKLFDIQAMKKGIVFPVFVNILAVLALAVGLGAIIFLFQREEEALIEESSPIETAEGKLLKELKKEAEERLQEKEEEIANIQKRLEDISQERNDLLATMEDRIAAKERELQNQLEAELEAERKRLIEEGFTDEEIQKRLEEFERQKTQELNQRLEEFREEAEAEIQEMETNLQQLQTEYQQQLDEANAERERIIEESAQREAELQERLETEREQAEAELSEAEAQLNRLAQQQEKEALVNDQIIGFYSKVEDTLEAGNLDAARENLISLRQYLNNPTVVILPNLQKRRETELFVIQALLDMIEAQKEAEVEEVNTQELISAATLVREVQDLVGSADQLINSGQIEEGERLYTQALSKIPEVNRTYTYFQEKVDPAEIERKQNFEEVSAQARLAFEEENYLLALELYSRALNYLPEDTPGKEDLVSDIQQAGSELAKYEFLPQNYAGANQLFAQANNLAAGGEYQQAIQNYMNILSRFPDSNVVPQIPARINTAVEGALIQTEAAVAEETRKRTITEIDAEGLPNSPEAEVLLQQADRRRISGSFDEAVPVYFRILEEYPGTKQAAEVPQKLFAAVEGLVDRLQNESDDLQQQLAEAASAVETLETEKARLETEKEDARKRLTSVQTRAEELQAELEAASTAEGGTETASSASSGTVSAEANEKTLRELEAARTEISRLENRISELSDDIGGLEGDIEEQQRVIEEQENAIAERDRLLEEQQQAANEFREEAEGEIGRLSEYEEAYNVLRERYGAYGDREEAILSESDRPDLLAAKLELDKFLASDIVREVFPGLIDRLKRYDRAFEEAGRETVAQEVIEIVYDMSFFETEREREDFLEQEKERYVDEPMMLDLIDELIALVNA